MLSVRGRPVSLGHHGGHERISIHALREEGDQAAGWDPKEQAISIHALRRRYDRHDEVISIHALHEEGDLQVSGLLIV